MKLIYEPSVYLVGRQQVNVEEVTQFLEHHEVDYWKTDTLSPAEQLCEVAGRTCYMSFTKPRPGGNKAYLDRIIESQHGSVLEHACWNFILTGISRSLTHELVRHRQGVGYSQLSQRYVDESIAEYVVPPELKAEVQAAMKFRDETMLADHNYPARAATPEERAGSRWLTALEVEHKTYVELVEHLMEKGRQRAYNEYLQRTASVPHEYDTRSYDFDDWSKLVMTKDQTTEIRKAARGAARSVLPNATETKIFLTANARALRHMIEMRCSRHADVEIRILFGRILFRMIQEAPNIFDDYTIIALTDGTFEAKTPHRKV